MDTDSAPPQTDSAPPQSVHYSRPVPFSGVTPVSQQLRIFNNGVPGPGGALPNYAIVRPDDTEVAAFSFQNGTLPEVGVNGVTLESLIAICIDQLQQFQEGAFRSRENACAITKLEEAAMWLEKRTRNRQARGVEGTYQK